MEENRKPAETAKNSLPGTKSQKSSFRLCAISENRLHWWLFAIIVAIAAILRFYQYTGFSLSNDELSALSRTQFDTFRELVDKGFFVDGHPGGIQVLLFYWIQLFGISEASVRLPFVLMGVLAVVFTWLTARLWYGRTTALFIAASIALLQFPLLYSQVARPYGSGLFFAMATAYFWTKVVFYFKPCSRKAWFDIAGYTLANIAMMYNHYFSFLLAIIIGLTGLFLLSKQNRWFYIVSGIVSALAFTPHIPITLNHLSIGGVGLWLGKPEYNWMIGHISYLFNNSLWVLALVVFVALSGFLSSQKVERKTWLLRGIALIWFITPAAVGFFYSRMVNPVLQHSVLIFSFPFLMFAIFSFPFWKQDATRLIMLMIFSATVFGSTVIQNNHYNSQHFGEFRDIAAKITEWDKLYGEENITRAISVNNPWYIEYYLKQHNSTASFAQYDNRGMQHLFELKEILSNIATPYFAYAWTKAVPDETHWLILHYYPYIIKDIDYSGLSRITLFSRKPNNAIAATQPKFRICNDFEDEQLWTANSAMKDSSQFYSGNFSIRFDNTTEFGPALEVAASDLHVKEGSLIVARAMVRTTVLESQALLVFSLEQWGEAPYMWYGSLASNYAIHGEWSPVFLARHVKELKSARDILKVYIWNPGYETLWIDDLCIAVYPIEQFDNQSITFNKH
ncbi:MAG TPA: glycosyltransferase family 39 protein [Bacteroidales bacterium]|nr:glycosyltransferase family 39 protein [Bacteroidales bacterium]